MLRLSAQRPQMSHQQFYSEEELGVSTGIHCRACPFYTNKGIHKLKYIKKGSLCSLNKEAR